MNKINNFTLILFITLHRQLGKRLLQSNRRTTLSIKVFYSSVVLNGNVPQLKPHARIRKTLLFQLQIVYREIYPSFVSNKRIGFNAPWTKCQIANEWKTLEFLNNIHNLNGLFLFRHRNTSANHQTIYRRFDLLNGYQRSFGNEICRAVRPNSTFFT